jgi:hypothetical protein
LWLDQHQINEQHDEIMLDIFVGEAFAAWALCEPHTFAESLVVGFAVGSVKRADWVATLDTDWHCKCLVWSLCVFVLGVDGVKFEGPIKTLARGLLWLCLPPNFAVSRRIGNNNLLLCVFSMLKHTLRAFCSTKRMYVHTL